MPFAAVVLGAAVLWTIVPLGCGSPSEVSQSAAPEGPSHYIFFNLSRQRIEEPSFLENPAIAGAQLKYTWRELEPERDVYDFETLLLDLEYLESYGKRMFIQLQDVTFDHRINVPEYLVTDEEFSGGAERKYNYDEATDQEHFDGWVARRWDPTVIERFVRLMHALGEQVDGRVEGISLPETAIEFGRGEATRPPGYSPESYAEGIQAIMSGAAEAFPRSHVVLYANFMPGEWLPWEDQGHLRGVYEHAQAIGIGIGGPDLKPFRKGQQNHGLALIRERPAAMVAGLAVQWGNLEEIDPETGAPVTVQRLHDIAQEDLRLDYLFWGTQEPFYTDDVLPYLRALTE